jgi:hypothetical protein
MKVTHEQMKGQVFITFLCAEDARRQRQQLASVPYRGSTERQESIGIRSR